MIGIAFGTRPIDVGTDTYSYYHWFNDIRKAPIDNIDLSFGKDPMLKLIFWTFSQFTTIEVTLGFISGLFTFLCFLFSKNVCKTCGYGNGFILFLVTLYSFASFNFEINIIRAGLGTAFWALFTINFYKRDKKTSIAWGLLAIFTHFSTIIFIAMTIMARYLRYGINKYVISFFVFLLMSFIGISILGFVDFNALNFEKVARYTENISNSDYKTGFRAGFAIFNIAFLAIPFFLRNSLNNLEKYYFRLYVLCSIVFFLWFAIPYSDRIGAFSWFIIPTVTYLPLTHHFGNSPTLVLYCLIYGLINSCI
jgi:membrane protein